MSYHHSKTSILSSLDNDYIEEGRQDIYRWGESRKNRRTGVRGWSYSFQKRFIDLSIIKSFVNNMTVSVVIQLVLSALCTYICQRLDLYLDLHIALFVSPIVFPLAFSINADFQRREHVLEDLALFKGGLIVMFFCHRDWQAPAGLSPEFLKAVTNKLKGLILNVKEYLLTEQETRRSYILQVIYEDFSDISQLNEKLRVALPESSSASLIQRVIHYHNLMFWAFERLRVVREYRSPRGIRSFTKVFIFVMPLLLSPYYVLVGKQSNNTWGPYYVSLISTFIFGTLQGVQDVLDDPFDGISEDDVNLGSLEDWTAHSLLTNRTYTVGRFTVTASIETEKRDKDAKDNLDPAQAVEHRDNLVRNASFKRKIHVPMRSILRRGPHRPAGEKTDATCEVSEQDVNALYPEMASRLHSMKQKDITGSTTILPGLNVKDRPCDSFDDADTEITLGTPSTTLRIPVVTEAEEKRHGFKKNVSFSRDLDHEASENSFERISELSVNETDSSPLLRLDSPDTANDNIGYRYAEPDPDKVPKSLRATLEQLEHISGTDRVVHAKRSKNLTPPSLACLFDPPVVEAPTKDESVHTPSLPSSVFDPSKLETDGSGETQPPLVEISHPVTTPQRSRFSVSSPEEDQESCEAASPMSLDESLQRNASHIEKEQPPYSGDKMKTPDIRPTPSRFAVTPTTQSTLEERVIPVNETTPEDESQHGQTNLAMSSPSASSVEDNLPTNHIPHKKLPKFSVSKATEHIPTNTPKNQDDSCGDFWDFDSSSDVQSSVGQTPSVGISGDATNKNPKLLHNSRSASLDEMLNLSGSHGDEVYI